MYSFQLSKAIKIAKETSKTVYIATSNQSFCIDFNYCKYTVDSMYDFLIIEDSFLDDTIIIDIKNIIFVETKLKHL